MNKLNYTIFMLFISHYCLSADRPIPSDMVHANGPQSSSSRVIDGIVIRVGQALPEDLNLPTLHSNHRANEEIAQRVVIQVDQALPARYSLYNDPYYQAHEEQARQENRARIANNDHRFRAKMIAGCVLGYLGIGLLATVALRLTNQI